MKKGVAIFIIPKDAKSAKNKTPVHTVVLENVVPEG